MKWIYKLERKFPNAGIRNLMTFIIIGQAMVAGVELLAPDIMISTFLRFSWGYILQGQVWRIFTFLFVPQGGTIIGVAITFYLYYFIGEQLEATWGTFRFNAYYWFGALGAIIAGILSHYLWFGAAGTNYYLHLSLYLAFAVLYPDVELLLFFVLPVKVKYLGMAAGAYLALLFFMRSWPEKIAILFSIANFLLFFGGSFFRKIKQELGYRKTRNAWRRANRP